uniref:non-specific serine/threonine protein kinase n=1 Tax=Fagus sylvatica TaxID=28930 RepID=A0A2N9H3K0_FAGSY
MGNCLEAQSKLDNSVLNSGVTKVPNTSGQSFVPSSMSVHVPSPRSEGDILSSPNLKPFTYSELKNATRNFRPDSLLGKGGFGYVYKGWIDEHTLGAGKPGCGMIVAVKKLNSAGLKGHNNEWLCEVNRFSQLHHPNLVKLIGYCLEGDKRLLVYEYMPKGSLENHLFRRGAQTLSWEIRIKVAIDAARGLSFLHDSNQVLHRNFKGANILFDSEFNAKVSDFGFVKSSPSHFYGEIFMYTLGYADPEWIYTGCLSTKSVVYSFGVVLLELLSGRRAHDETKVAMERSLVGWAKPYLSDRRKLFWLMDTKLEGQYPEEAAYAAAVLASQCISDHPKNRPQMSEVLATLEQLPSAKYANSSASNPFLNSPLKNSHPSPLNISP